MNENPRDTVRRLTEDFERFQANKPVDYRHMTAPCGLPCFVCYLHLAEQNEEIAASVSQVASLPADLVKCKGCRDEDGKCEHLSMPCRVYPCAREKGVEFCSDCTDFPCDLLHPYVDQAQRWHNAKVFNLCLIKKMGLESWARDKARSVRDRYFYGEWRL